MEDGLPIGSSPDILKERITFVVPSNSEFERIVGFENFTALWNISSSNLINVSSDNYDISSEYQMSVDEMNSVNGLHSFLTSISKGSKDELHQILNYLWIGTVVTLVILSLVLIVFSFYFYRKFIEWKQCNKDIQSQMPIDLQIQHKSEHSYYNMESPPCYTIATGLPSYSEALVQHALHYEHKLSYLWHSSLWVQDRHLQQLSATQRCSKMTSEQADNLFLRPVLSFSKNISSDNPIDVVVLT